MENTDWSAEDARVLIPACDGAAFLQSIAIAHYNPLGFNGAVSGNQVAANRIGDTPRGLLRAQLLSGRSLQAMGEEEEAPFVSRTAYPWSVRIAHWGVSLPYVNPRHE